MAKPKHTQRRWMEAALAGLLLWSFFLPWLYSLGTQIAGDEIRERLRGAHEFVSIFTSDSRVSSDYKLSICLYAIPVCAGFVLILLLLRKYRAWAGFLAGAAAVTGVLFLRSEAHNFPFHRLASGAYLALSSGVGFFVLPILRMGKRAG